MMPSSSPPHPEPPPSPPPHPPRSRPLPTPTNPATPSHTRSAAADRGARRVRILASLQEGWSYDKIAVAEGLTRERIRQIVVELLEQREVDPPREHAILQSARLDGALRLAVEKVADGELNAIYPLLKVLERLDKYQGAAAAFGVERSKD